MARPTVKHTFFIYYYVRITTLPSVL
uniref:Uncharacterized protein n=1 Tax=Anguilla anguilla TaxID=7936 RepID=A0A0E9QIL2_ANGAN